MNVVLLPATLIQHKSALFEWNSMRLLQCPRRYKYYAKAPQYYVIVCTLHDLCFLDFDEFNNKLHLRYGPISYLRPCWKLGHSYPETIRSSIYGTILLNGEREQLCLVSTTVILLYVVNLTRWCAEWTLTSQDEYNGSIVISYSDTKENKINKISDMKDGWRSRLGVPSICAALWVWEKGYVAGWWLLRWLPRTRDHFTTRRRGAYLLPLTWVPQLSRDVTVDAGCMCVKAAVLWWAMKATLCIYDLHVFTSRYILVSKMTRLRCGWWGNRGSNAGGAREFCVLKSVQTDSGTHPASYSMGKGNPLPSTKAAGAVKL
jgi:hypothetical protein